MTDRKYAVQYMDGDEMCTRPCSTLGTAVMVRNHTAATGHEDAMLVEVEAVEIIARSGSFSVTTDPYQDLVITRDGTVPTAEYKGDLSEVYAMPPATVDGTFVPLDGGRGRDYIFDLTRDQLRIMAKDLDIAGRGGMDKGQLRAAVLQAYGYTS